MAQTPAPSHAWIGRGSTWRACPFPGLSLRQATLCAEQANPNTVSERPVAAAEVTYGELVKGESGGVFAQSIRDCQSHLVLHRREELEVSDVTPVFGKDILLADHLFRAVSGKQSPEDLLPTEQCSGWGCIHAAGGRRQKEQHCVPALPTVPMHQPLPQPKGCFPPATEFCRLICVMFYPKPAQRLW